MSKKNPLGDGGRRGGKPGKTKGIALGRNLETGKTFLLRETDDVNPADGKVRKTFRILGRNDPN